jgi:protein TonB
LVWAIVLSVGLHGLLFIGLLRPMAGSFLAGPAARASMHVELRRAPENPKVPEEAQQPPEAAQPSEKLLPPQVAPSPSGQKAVEVQPEAPSVPAALKALPAAPGYHASQGLDPAPRFLTEIEPDYPQAARLQEGSVVLRFLISATGEVDEVAVVRSTPPGVFEQAALQAYAKARFSPGYFLGIAVKSQKTIEVMFTPTNRAGAVDGTNPIPPSVGPRPPGS